MNNWISAIAILGPTLVAVVTIITHAIISRANNRNERAKLFYQDRLKALTSLVREASRILRNMEEVLHLSSIMQGKYDLSKTILSDNERGNIPPELYDSFRSVVFGCTIVGRVKFRQEVDSNAIFYSGGVRQIAEQIDTQILSQIPEPVLPEHIAEFVVQHIGKFRELVSELIVESQRLLMVNKG